MSEQVKGVAAILGACTIWGLSPLYYKLLAHVPPIEVLAHRTLWSCAFFAALLLVQGRLGLVRLTLARRRDALVVGFAALMISTNWFFFITSIQIGKAIEASLGYYTFPLASVVLGALVFGERLGRAQILAVALAAVAVTVLTAGLGVAPWIALILACSFGLYGVVKKALPVGPVVSVTAEVLILSPVALAVLAWVHGSGAGRFGADIGDSLLLMLSGPLTGLPLILFSAAARRLRLATVGLLQYLNPTLQFTVATLVFGEVFSRWHAIAFALIWTALAVYSIAAWRQDRALRRLVQTS